MTIAPEQYCTNKFCERLTTNSGALYVQEVYLEEFGKTTGVLLCSWVVLL
jgi:hypothetical protein